MIAQTVVRCIAMRRPQGVRFDASQESSIMLGACQNAN